MKQLFFTLLAFITYPFTGLAQIIYHDISPDTTVDTWNVFTIAPFGGAQTANGNYIDIWFHPTPEVVVTSWNDFQVMISGSYPAKLNMGDSISAGANWMAVSYQPLNSGGMGNWLSNATDKYLGFRIKNGTVWNYGWLKMSVSAGPTSFTVEEWAVDTTGNKINAGQAGATDVTELVPGEMQLHADPNPASSELQIQVPDGVCGDLSIFDNSGRPVFEARQRKGMIVVPVKDYPAGIYFVRCGGYRASFIKQ